MVIVVRNFEFDDTLVITFIIGRDFAVTRSSPLTIVSEQTVKLKMADVESAQQLIPFITCEISFG